MCSTESILCYKLVAKDNSGLLVEMYILILELNILRESDRYLFIKI